MEVIIKAAAVLAVGCTLAVLLKQNNGAFALLLAVAVCAAVIALSAELIGSIASFAVAVTDLGGISAPAVGIVFKTVGIALITKLTADICRDAGQNAMASCAEMVGSVSAVYVILPLMESVIEMIETML